MLLLGFHACLLVLTPGRSCGDEITLSGSNRLEYGLARADGDESSEDLFRVDARWRGFTLEGRLHLTQPTTGAVAESLDQRSFRFEDEHVDLLAGTFYETWGRGLILRAYEARTAVVGRLERSLALDRDIDGVRVRGGYGPARLTILSGRPQLTPVSGSANEAPSGRIDRIRGARAEVDITSNVQTTGSFLRINGPGFTDEIERDEFSSLSVSGDAGGFDGYAEVAHRWDNPELFIRNGDAIYASLGYSTGPFAFTGEFKDYEQFLTPYNEPPTLVKTHSWTLLNRQTHVSNPDDEVGFQFEGAWSRDPETGLTLTHGRSDNHDSDDIFEYRQGTLEGRHRLGDTGPRLRGVVDWSRDVIKGDQDRLTAGADVEVILDDRNSLAGIFEWQRVDHVVGETDTHRLLTLEFQRSPWLSLALQGETGRLPIDERDTWASLTANVSWDGRHNLNLFAGRRPTGLLCTGGYCFLAPAFDGVEMRLISRFD